MILLFLDWFLRAEIFMPPQAPLYYTLNRTVKKTPPPASAASAAPALDAVRAAVARGGGWIPFDRFLDVILHDPRCGFYGAGRVEFGVDGDFATAPVLSPLFAECVAAQAADILRETGGGVLEVGAGDGRFARDLAGALARDGIAATHEILETSPALRARQQALLRGAKGDFRWRETLPEQFAGVIFANETLDAVPFRLFFRRKGEWLERGVAWSGRVPVFADRPAAPDAATARLNETGLPDESVAEVNLRAEALVRSLAEKISRGILLMADYGHGRGALYHPDRANGTLMCHRAGRADDNPLESPGAKDVTAQVDFTAMADAGMSGGCELLGFAAQARFLVNCGILESITAKRGESADADYARLSSGAHKLLAPHEMGDIVKFIAWGKGVSVPLRGFATGDIRHKL